MKIKITDKLWVDPDQVEFLEVVAAEHLGDHSNTNIGFVSGKNRIVKITADEVAAMLDAER